jgi:hypothetical protein
VPQNFQHVARRRQKPAFNPQRDAKFPASATRDKPDGIVAQMVRLAGSERVGKLVDELLSIRNPANRSMALLPVLPYLTMPLKEKIATAALEASRGVNDGEQRDHLVAWLRLFEPDPHNTRNDIALPFESYSSSSRSGKRVGNYDGAAGWLRAMPERGPQRENLAKCYLRNFVRNGNFFWAGRDGKPTANHRLLELIPYLGHHGQLAVCRMLRAKLRTLPKTARPGLTAEYLEYIPPAVKAQVHNLATARKRVSVALPSSSQLGLPFRTLVRETGLCFRMCSHEGQFFRLDNEGERPSRAQICGRPWARASIRGGTLRRAQQNRTLGRFPRSPEDTHFDKALQADCSGGAEGSSRGVRGRICRD